MLVTPVNLPLSSLRVKPPSKLYEVEALRSEVYQQHEEV